LKFCLKYIGKTYREWKCKKDKTTPNIFVFFSNEWQSFLLIGVRRLKVLLFSQAAE